MHDDDTAIMRQVLRRLFADHPLRVSLAFCGSIFLNVCIKIGIQYYDYAWLKVLNDTATWEVWVIVAGAALLPILFGKGGTPELVKTQINAIENLIEAAHLPKYQAALVWKELIDRYIKSLSTDFEKQKSIDIVEQARIEIDDARKISR
jgi:CTP:phosphocholine cytidylyltransferase-like protein